MTTTPRYGITQWEEDQALPEVVGNEAVLTLEQMASGAIVKDKDLATPPGSPAEGDAYIVATSGTGAWAGHDGEIAYYASGWRFITPIEGTEAYVQDENAKYSYNGTAWAIGSYLPLSGGTLTGDLNVPDEAYDATSWNGSTEVPTKNAVRDKIEALVLGASSFRGALVRKAADQTGANYTTAAAVAWDQEAYDTDTIHDNVTNNSRLSVPVGVSYVRLSANIQLANVTADGWCAVFIRKNGGAFDGRASAYTEVGNTNVALNVSTAVVAVTGGTDWFDVTIQTESDTSIDVNAASSWFAMEIVA